MTDLGQYQTGKLKSTSKMTAVKADDGRAILYKNMGNNHNYPMLWCDTLVLTASGSEVVVASGVSFHGNKLADTTACSIVFSPYGDPGDVRMYVDCDIDTNVVKIKSTGVMASDLTLKVMAFIGADADVSGLNCRGNVGSMPTYP